MASGTVDALILNIEKAKPVVKQGRKVDRISGGDSRIAKNSYPSQEKKGEGMKRFNKFTMLLCVLFLLSGITGMANATLITIGTAGYDGGDYNLIWDDDNNGNSLVWLDFTNSSTDWTSQVAWADGLNGSGILDINLDAGYTVDWETNVWRLPTTVDGSYVYGYDGTTTGGYNITNSEMGHLYYTELGNSGSTDTSGSVPQAYGLIETGDFDNLIASWYWSGTKYASSPDDAWTFYMSSGNQDPTYEGTNVYGLVVLSGQVSVSPVPEPGTLFLLGIGLVGFSGLNR